MPWPPNWPRSETELAETLAGGGQYVRTPPRPRQTDPREADRAAGRSTPFLLPFHSIPACVPSALVGVECVLQADPTVQGGPAIVDAQEDSATPRSPSRPDAAQARSAAPSHPEGQFIRAGGCSAISPGSPRRASRPSRWCSDNSTAGGTYMPGMSDHVVMIQGRSKVFSPVRPW